MSLATFCDLVWVEIWQDVSMMSDIHTYHRIVGELFLEGKDPYDITWEVEEYDKALKKNVTKTKRLADQPTAATRAQQMKSGMAQLEEWRARSAQLKAEGVVASSPDE